MKTGRSLLATFATFGNRQFYYTMPSSSSSSSSSSILQSPLALHSTTSTGTSENLSSPSPPSSPPPPPSSSPPPPPLLQGVIFDMDGTLTIPNIDFGEMYRRCGVDPTQDILQCVQQMPPTERQRALAIIEEVEEQGRQTMELMPGAIELIQWLQAHKIPMAIVTRNTYQTTTVLTTQRLQSAYSFSPIIARDQGYPAKPDPAALRAIAKEWNIALPSDSLVMVGDSLQHDVVFGNKAGVRTALLSSTSWSSSSSLSSSSQQYNHNDNSTCTDTNTPTSSTNQNKNPSQLEPHPDILTPTLWHLANKLWKQYRIPSPLGEHTLPKWPQPKPTTALTKAAASGDLQSIQQLVLNQGISINEVDSHGNTALIWAVEHNQTSIVQYLLSSFHEDKINVNHRGYLGSTAICRAARRGYDNLVTMLIQQQQQPQADVNLPNDKLQYPLHFAAFQQHMTVVQSLLEGGANPLVLDRKGRTPAQDTSNPEIQQVLWQAEQKTMTKQ